MNSGQLMGIFIIILMIGSIVGFTTYFTDGSENTDDSDFVYDDSNLPDSTTIQMTATEVKAKVVDKLPKIFFTAFTNEADITVIDKKIALVEGVYKIDSRYKQLNNSSFGTSLIYAAEVSFDKKRDSVEVISEINEATKDFLFDSVANEMVLVSVPKNVYFSNEQGFDVNYEFTDPLNLAYVIPGTQKEDFLTIRIDGYFTGKTLVNSIASETRPGFFSFDLNKSIESKLPRIIFGLFADYSDFPKEQELKEKILEFDGIIDVNINGFAPENYFVVFFDADSDLKEEFNVFLEKHPVFSSIDVSKVGNGFSAQLNFAEGLNIKELEQNTLDFLKDNNVSNISVSEARGQLFGSVELISSDSSEIILKLTALFDELNFINMEFQQEAVVLFDVFTAENGAEFIADDLTSTQVFVKPERKEGEEVELKIQIESSIYHRKKITSITASEE